MKKIIGIVTITIGLILSLVLVRREETKEKETNPFEVLGSLAYTLDGERTTESYGTLITNNEVNKITCEKGTLAVWNKANKTLKLNNIQIPDYCTIDFKSNNKENLNVTNGSVNENGSFNSPYEAEN